MATIQERLEELRQQFLKEGVKDLIKYSNLDIHAKAAHTKEERQGPLESWQEAKRKIEKVASSVSQHGLFGGKRSENQASQPASLFKKKF